MRGGAAEVQGLDFPGAYLAHGATRFQTRCAKQASNLLEVKLNCVCAENFWLRETGTDVAHLPHAFFKARDVTLQVEVGRSILKAPGMNAFRDVLKS